jgi:triosephosphate isomerase (TIM)
MIKHHNTIYKENKLSYIFVNLKRFDIPKKFGGICPFDNPADWIRGILKESIDLKIDAIEDIELTFLPPEALIPAAIEELQKNKNYNIGIGSQGVFRDDVREGENIGAFTTNLPASAARNLGCSWSIIGHSEERKDKLEIITEYDKSINSDEEKLNQAIGAVNNIINKEIISSFESNINVLVCVGESKKEYKGDNFYDQKNKIKKIIENQIRQCLKGVDKYLSDMKLVIGYEPVWAIGPGKTPPGKDYISFVSRFIKDTVKKVFDFDVKVVYGGGLKEENAGMLASIDSIDGGLVALTKFTEDVGFEPSGLERIIKNYKEVKIL